MGLLDDAIREHLDLKRRRGADPAEVERAAREALGPVRRGAESPAEVEPGVDEAPAYDQDDELAYHEDDDELAYDHHDDAHRGEPFDDEPDGLTSPRAGAPGSDEPRTTEEPPARRARESHDPEAPDEPFASDEPLADAPGAATPAPHRAPASPPPQQTRAHVGEETAEYDVEGALPKEAGKEGEDVLEETPEFLQDTPDHDRLWFEQRPPRDFDFEG